MLKLKGKVVGMILCILMASIQLFIPTTSNASNPCPNTVAFSGISSNCVEKTFTLKAYGDTSATPLTLATVTSSGYTQATFKFTTSTIVGPGLTSANVSVSGGTETIGFQGTTSTSGAVYKLTLESQ